MLIERLRERVASSPILGLTNREFFLRNEESSKSGNEPGINCPRGYGYNNMLPAATRLLRVAGITSPKSGSPRAVLGLRCNFSSLALMTALKTRDPSHCGSPRDTLCVHNV